VPVPKFAAEKGRRGNRSTHPGRITQGAFILDVRQLEQWAKISKAMLIPLSGLSIRFNKAPTKTKKIVVVCRIDHHSASKRDILKIPAIVSGSRIANCNLAVDINGLFNCFTTLITMRISRLNGNWNPCNFFENISSKI
jgi:hypothetical protein